MTDLLRLATELERSGGVHRFVALVQAASLVMLRFEHGESVTVRGERWPLPVTDEERQRYAIRAQDKCDAFDLREAAPLADCQDKGRSE